MNKTFTEQYYIWRQTYYLTNRSNTFRHRRGLHLLEPNYLVPNPQQLNPIFHQKMPEQIDSRGGCALLERIWIPLPSSGGRGFSPAPALCCAVPSGASYSCHASVLPAEVKVKYTTVHNSQHSKSCSLARRATTSTSEQRKVAFKPRERERRYLADQPLPFCFDLLFHFFIKAPDFSIMIWLLPTKHKCTQVRREKESTERKGGWKQIPTKSCVALNGILTRLNVKGEHCCRANP